MFNPKVRAWLELNGLKTTATEAEARGLLAALQARGITTDLPVDIDEGGQRSLEPLSLPNDPPPPSLPEQGSLPEHGGVESLDREQARLAEIDMYLKAYPAAESLRGMLISDLSYRGSTIAQAVGQFVSARANTSLPGHYGGAGSATIPKDGDSLDKRRAAMVDGLLMRQGRPPANLDKSTGQPLQQRKYAEGAEAFRGMSLRRMYELMLQDAGVSTRGLSDMDIVQRMLTRSAQTSYDFPALMGDYLNKTLTSVAADVERDWLPCVKVVSAMDFRTRHALQFGGANEFGVRREGGEFPMAKFRESEESYKPEVLGLNAQLTMEILLHDDLGAFDAQPIMMLTAQIAAERRKFFAALASTAVMSDGNPLFDAAHNNVSLVDATRGDIESLKAALKAMRIRLGKQITSTGIKTKVMPKTILCDLEDSDDLYTLTSEMRLATAANPLGAANPNHGMMVISADEIALEFFAFGDPQQHPVIEAAWFLGNQGVNFFSEPEFGGLGVKYLGWTGFGLGRVGWHGVDKTTVVLPTP